MDYLKDITKELKHLLIEALSKPRNLVFTFGGLGAALIAYFALKIYLNRRKYAHIPGPPTKGILGFFRGNTIEMKEITSKGKVFPEVLLEWRKKYGEVFKFQIFNEICVYTSDRDTIKEVLIEQNFPKSLGQAHRVGYPMGERLLGIGLLSDPTNERWKHRRAIFNPGFHRHVLMTFIDQFNQITNTLTEKFRTLADGKTVVHLFNEINKATLDAISLIAFGMNTDAVTQKESLLNSYLSRILQLLMFNAFDPFFRFRLRKRPQLLEFQRMIRYLRKIGKEKIMERLSAIQNNEHVPNDILTSILSGSKDDELDLEAMIDDFITFFIAGQETTANALAFCFLELGKRPELAIKAREEVDRVLGERTDMNYQDVNDLKYCSAIFKEALRLYPPAPLVTRQIKENISIKGIKIPSDTQLFMSTFVTSRDEQYFQDPLEFKPERFLKSANDHSMENYVYYPFSLGPRNCIGQTFAQLEGVVVIAKMVQMFDIKLDPTQSMAIDQALTLRPKDGTRCFLTVRS